jgi:Tfp pilus assembly ATPase PilU
MAGMYCMKDLLELVLREGAKELRLKANQAPVILLASETHPIEGDFPTKDNLAELFQSIATKEQWAELDRCGDIRFIYMFKDFARFAVTASMQREGLEVRCTNLGR